MKRYEIIKVWHDGCNMNMRTIAESGVYNSREEAECERIYLQVDYDEKLEVRELECNV